MALCLFALYADATIIVQSSGRTSITAPVPVDNNIVAIAAAQLVAGESIKIDLALEEADLLFNGGNILQWGSSASYKSQTKEILLAGKHAGGTLPYRFLRCDLIANDCSAATDPWSTANANGHAYDHNTIDTETGLFFHRPYQGSTSNPSPIYAWDGSSWSLWDSIPDPIGAANSITWWPGVGMISASETRIKVRNLAGVWSETTFSGGANPNHVVSERNPARDVLIWGSGNNDVQMRKRTAAGVITEIANPPFNVGSASSQGVLCSDPTGPYYFGYNKNDGAFAVYDIDADSWSSGTRSTGDGASAQSGFPNLGAGLSVMCAVIEEYDVTLWIQYVSGGNANAWLYKH